MKANPGSDEARAQGCQCPVMDNNHGKRAPWGDDGWWINGACPLHGNNDEGVGTPDGVVAP